MLESLWTYVIIKEAYKAALCTPEWHGICRDHTFIVLGCVEHESHKIRPSRKKLVMSDNTRACTPSMYLRIVCLEILYELVVLTRRIWTTL